MNTVAFHTLGCKVNQYDTQAMLELFRAAGYTVVPFEGDADIYVINTCTVTGTGDRKSMQLARRVRREHPDSELVLAGCLAQRGGESLKKTGARLIIGTQHRGQVVELLEKAVAGDVQLCAVEELTAAAFEPLRISSQEEHTRATMKIQEGCGNHCTYCIIPSVRGPIRSRPLQDVEDEARQLAAAGYMELVLTGIHLTSYGRDLPERPSLLDAIRRVHDLPGVARIRLGSLEPTVATPEFASALASLPKVCPQFHLALQSGSSTVLARMARRYNADMYREAVANLRRAFPMAAFTSDILTGFPGETEEEFEETRAMIREVGFARIHVFPFSPREGTKAAIMPGQLPNSVKEERVRILMADGQETARRYEESWLGRESTVLAEELEDGVLYGYTPEYIRTALPDCPPERRGQLIPVTLTDLIPGGMIGRPIA